jgi:hypothetical protein
MPAECLECLIGATRVEVPLAEVERLLEYQAAPPPPLAQPWLGGIGVADKEDLFLSVSLAGHAATGPRAVRGLLFRRGEQRLRWALEVDRVVGLRSVQESPGMFPMKGWVCPPEWLLLGQDDGGSDVRRFDVRAAEHALAHAEVTEPRG